MQMIKSHKHACSHEQEASIKLYKFVQLREFGKSNLGHLYKQNYTVLELNGLD